MTRLRRILNALTHTGPGPGYDPWARAHGEEIADIKTAHEAHRAALSEALGLGTSAPWEAITKHAQQASKRVRELRAESLRRGKEVVARNDRIMALERRAEEAEAEVKRLGLMVDEYSTGAQQLSEKLRETKAAITRVQDAAALHRKQLLSTAELYAVIEAALDGEQPPMPGQPLTTTQQTALLAAGLPPGTFITADVVCEAQDAAPAPRRTTQCWRRDAHPAHTWSWRWPHDAADCPGLIAPEEPR